MLGGAEVDRMTIEVGDGSGLGGDPSAGQPYFHFMKRNLSHVRLLNGCEGAPDGS